ncbi:MAG: hypothetical protein AAGG48_15720 [Planctomycetota bacterium]
MPKFPTIPQLTILVPVVASPNGKANLSGFERTLISVLENRPEQSEVLVTHDGSYDDPYALGDEVRFVTADHPSMTDLIAAGAQVARGRIIHVLAEGVEATPGWTDNAVDCFDHFDCGSVAPRIQRSNDQAVLACGWSDTTCRLMSPHVELAQSSAAGSRVGCYLQASFWRRDLLRSLRHCLTDANAVHADQASGIYSRLARKAGWKCDVAPDSILRCDGDQLPWDESSFSRGKRLRAVANQFGCDPKAAWTAACASLLRPSQWSEAIGGCIAGDLGRTIDSSQVIACKEESTIMKMPTRSSVAMRRAA